MDTPSESDVDNCPICMSPMSIYTSANAEEIAMLPCRHCYHDACLADWINTATSCPYCRTEFDKIDVLHQLGGPVVRSYTIELKSQEEQFSDSDDEADDISDDYTVNGRYFQPLIPDVTRCIICGSQDCEDVLMLCDTCDDCYHTFCLGDEAVPAGPFHCPNCVAVGDPHTLTTTSQDSVIRTVANLRSQARLRPRRTRRRAPTQRLQLETWTAAWSRVRERAWARLNEELDFEPIPDAQLTAGQEEELRQWRVRMARRGPSTSRTTTVEVPAEQDPATANLWKAFEQASKLSKVGLQSDGACRPSKHSSPQSPMREIIEFTSDTPGPSGHKQKRPNASNSKNSTNGRKRPNPSDLEASSATSKRVAVARHGSPEGSFLASLLSNIKHQPRHSDQPIKLITESVQQVDRPLSPLSNGPSLATSVTSSPKSPIRPQSRNSIGIEMSSHEALKSTTQPEYIRPLSPPAERSITKADIAKVVSAHLKPFYQRNKITKEEFIKINREVTRRIFEDYAHRTSIESFQNKLDDRVGVELQEELSRR